MNRLMAVGLACLLMASSTLLANDKTPLVIAKGAKIGVVNLLDAEVMHYHAARKVYDDFFKIQAVTWSVDDMLNSALKFRLGQLGLTPIPLAVTDSLARAREDCFVNAPLVKGLPANCSPSLVQLASSAGVDLLIVMAPGLNNADHTGSNHYDGVSAALRGWGLLTREETGSRDKPTLFSDTELLLIGITPQGATVRARKWGGTYIVKWQTYIPPADPKVIPADELNELQPLFAAVLSQQAKDLMDQVNVH